MSFFIYDDKVVGPKGDGDSIEKLTKAEYDALPDDVKNDGSIRLIVDSEGVVPGGGYEPDDITIKLNADNKLEAQQMTGATSSVAGTSGIIPAPVAGDQNKVLFGDGTWREAGKHLYQHILRLSSISGLRSDDTAHMSVISTSDTPFTTTTLSKWIYDNCTIPYPITGGGYGSSTVYIFKGVQRGGNESLLLIYYIKPSDGSSTALINASVGAVVDKVIQIL